MPNQRPTHVRLAIVGAGFGGLGMAIQAKNHAIDDFVVLEKADDLGGTWRDNGYPGCACDVPSHLYSYSFRLNPDWSRSFSPQPEIWAYLRDCAVRAGVLPHLRFGQEVTEARWVEDRRHWLIRTGSAEYTAAVLVFAGGPLSEPAIPAVPGLAGFTGVVFHSARWRHDLDLTGRRVAVVGTGASAIQFVPRIQPRVARLTVFQRTAPWILPRADRAISRAERAVYRHVPGAQRLARTAIYWAREVSAVNFLHPSAMRVGEALARRHLRRSVPDPALRAKLTPGYRMGCKRVLLSNDYLPALTKSNVELVAAGVREVRPDRVVATDGSSHPVDTIIFGTGFHVTDMPAAGHIYGRDGRSLAETWGGSMHSYHGVSFAGFPNLFMLLGPNTGLGHNSVVFMIEAAIDHVLAALDHLRRTGVAAIEPRPEAQRRYTEWIDRRMRGTVWVTGGCRSWYLDATGRNSTLWPSYSWRYHLLARRFRPADYRGLPAPARPTEAVTA